MAGGSDERARAGAPTGAREPLTEVDRLDGRTVLITGASQGLGLAVAVVAARLGARVLLADREPLHEAVRAVRAASGHHDVEGYPLDLADFGSITELAEILHQRNERVHVLVLDAGGASGEPRPSASGLDAVFQVHYLGQVALVERLLADGTVPNALICDGRPATPPARLIFIGSEAHRDAPDIDWARFGVPRGHGPEATDTELARTKLLVHTYAEEMSRRLQWPGGIVDVAVHHLGLGAVDDGAAADAIAWLAASRALEERSGLYLAAGRATQASEAARDPSEGERLWERSVAMIRDLDPSFVRAVKPEATPAPAPRRR